MTTRTAHTTAARRWRAVSTATQGRSRLVLFSVLVMVGYVGTVVAANWASVHAQPLLVGSILVPAGTLLAGITLALRDGLQETAGWPGVVAAIAAGAGLSWLLASPEIAVASAAAFLASELVDSAVYTRLRARSRLGGILASNAAGLVIDSVIFVPLAFGSLAALPGQILGKTAATIAAVAAVAAGRTGTRLARR